MEELKLCDGKDKSALDEQLTGHPWHCPRCDLHLTSLFCYPGCGTRYNEPDRAACHRALAALLAERVPERVLQLAAELATSKSY